MRHAEMRNPVARVLRGDSLPVVSRPNYRAEFRAAIFFPLAVSCVDMGVIGVVATKALSAGAPTVALLESAPHAAALSSVLWTSLMHGRDRVRFVLAMQLGLVLCVAVAALLPVGALGLGLMVGAVFVARCFFVGILAGRTEVWRANYPRRARARASGVFTIVTTVVVALTTLGLGRTLDLAGAHAVLAYRVFYLSAALVACAGIWNYSKVRWRGRRAILRAERTTDRARRPGLVSMWRVLRTDRTYRRFMSAQMVMGSANLAAQVPVVLAIADRFELSYAWSLAITAVVPKITMVATVPVWSRLLSKLHIIDFRALHAWSFVLGNGLVGVGVLTLNVPLMLVARGIVGAGMAGGTLAWNLGHHDFAPREQANTYMGVHVVLTGIRGATAPLLGALLYAGWDHRVGGAHLVWAGLGGWVFIVCAAAGAVGAMMFVRMKHQRHAALRDNAAGPRGPGSEHDYDAPR